MEILESKTNDILVLTFKGRLDANHANAAQERVVALIDKGETRLVADLSQLEYISSAGLRVMLALAKRLKDTRGALALCAMGDPVRQVFDLAGFMPLFAVEASRDAAVKRVAGG